ncbi:MAG: MotA/TolQ/ExbB proton channel family protein [Deltaproteobacteria bacterium]|nr:MotA/TolQ/ExbB proton channel family protein [Deltaproteobacteria bacterium]
MITDLVVSFSRTGAGDVVMWLMVLLSVASAAVMIERLIFFTRGRSDPSALVIELEQWLQGESDDDGANVAKGAEGFEARVLRAAIDAAPRGRNAIVEMAEAAKKAERARYERGLAFLGTVGNNAPFIGLFGTVLEIVSALYELGTQSAGNAGAGAVMATLSAALAATAVGLVVALPAVAAFNYFQRRIKGLTTSADVLIHTFLSYRA